MSLAAQEHLASETFHCMGSPVRITVGFPTVPGQPSPDRAAAAARRWLERYEARLSRFDGDSETAGLNADRRLAVPASPLLLSVVRAATWAADRSGGLVDPTLLRPLEAAGYEETRPRSPRLQLRAALEHAPTRKPAGPATGAPWRELHVDNARGRIERPRRIRFDPASVGRAFAVDLIGRELRRYSRFAIEFDGEQRFGGVAASWSPQLIAIENPVRCDLAHVLQISYGAVATSSVAARLWRRPSGEFAHHLLDPATGKPAWTGLVAATAVAPTALEAEMLAKTALLSGPVRAHAVLSAYGGVTVRDNGRVELHGPIVQTRPLPNASSRDMPAARPSARRARRPLTRA